MILYIISTVKLSAIFIGRGFVIEDLILVEGGLVEIEFVLSGEDLLFVGGGEQRQGL